MFYASRSLMDDLKAGLVVSLVALPLCLGIALASGAPAIAGLLGGIIGGLVIGVLSPSQISVSGPAAGLTVVVLHGIEELGSFQAFLPALVLAGILQLILGGFKLGKASRYIHESVVEGMLGAIGMMIIITQLPYVLGLSNSDYTGIFTTSSLHLGAMIIGLGGLSFAILLHVTSLHKHSAFKLIPLSMVLVITASIAAYLFSFTDSLKLTSHFYVNLNGIVSGKDVFSTLMWPDFSQLLSWSTVKYAIIIAAIASLETLLCIRAADQIDPLKHTTPPDKELLAQGVGNTLSGLLGGLPITSVIVRTSVNTQAGAKTKVASISHGFILLIGLLAFPRLITLIPLSILACLLVLAGFNLAHPKRFYESLQKGCVYWIPFFITLAVALFEDLLVGVILGQCVSIGLNYWQKQHPHAPSTFRT